MDPEIKKNTKTEEGATEKGTAAALQELINTVAKLRAPDGCPWDRVQTHTSLKAACIEEAAEVISAVNILERTGRSECLREELGDLLLQVVMHAQIAEEEGLFTLEDVFRTINEKMIRRHPHIFGSPGSLQNEAASSNEPSEEAIHASWKQIKAVEKKGREWEEPYLLEAFDETETLISVARQRKLSK